jgi:hypothetical protein
VVTTFATGTVVELLYERPGLQRLRVRFEDASVPGDRAYALTDLTGPVGVGDEVVCNVTAVALGLGTGGWHVVHWNLARRRLQRDGHGHVMKLRYTSLQHERGTSELDHPDLPDQLRGTVVVATTVHSQVGVIAAVAKSLRPDLTSAFVMTDGAALPLVLSDLVAELRERALLDLTVTCGHAFGGDLEAVSIPSALQLAAAVGRADVVIVGMGPGVVGTGTRYGTTATEAATVLDIATRLGAEPVLAVRASSADPRDRHRPVSHHTRAVAELSTANPWVAPVPDEVRGLPGVRVVEVIQPDVTGILADLDLSITTMGRGPAEDPLFFAAAGAAAATAVELHATVGP